MKEEMMDVVDEDDNFICKKTKTEILKNKFLSRGAMTMVLNSKCEILVHKRAKSKRLSPGFYDLFFGGGVVSGESYEECARRELEEETGIKSKPEFMFKIRFKSNLPVFVDVFKVVYDGELKLNKDEVEEVFFMKESELSKFIKSHKFLPDTIMAYNYYLKISKSKKK